MLNPIELISKSFSHILEHFGAFQPGWPLNNYICFEFLNHGPAITFVTNSVSPSHSLTFQNRRATTSALWKLVKTNGFLENTGFILPFKISLQFLVCLKIWGNNWNSKFN